jgi:YD repeat-containing protein
MVNVQGAMKLGNFSIAFTDMAFSVGNCNIVATRSYDSRDRARQGDFGYGWNLALSGAKLTKTGPIGENWEMVLMGGLPPRYVVMESLAHEITVNWGDGRKESFVPSVSPAASVTNYSYVSMNYLPKNSQTKSRLDAVGIYSDNLFISFLEAGIYTNDMLTRIYNPTRFQLTAEDGTAYMFNEKGDVESITDTLGNTVTISGSGIRHSDGKSIAFDRDGRGRIKTINGPTGKTVSYYYDDAGNLEKVVDITDAPTTFTYDKNHYMLEVFDPRGVRASRNVYDDDGRLVAMIDAYGNRMEFDHKIAERQQFVTDKLGYITIHSF